LSWAQSTTGSGTPGKPNFGTIPVGLYDQTTAFAKFKVTFTEDVSGTLGAAALTVANLGGGAVAPRAYSWDPATLTATWTFTQVPADGNYRATFNSAGVSDWAGNPVDGNGDSLPGGSFSQDFFFLAGDANHDRSVNFADLVVVAQNYDSPGPKTFAQGDFDGDGVVGFSDLVLVAQKYDTTLPADGAPVAGAPVNAAAFAALFPSVAAAAAAAPVSAPALATSKKTQPKRPLPTPPAPVKKPAKRPTFGKARIR
jgi:hypothetical protein